MPTIKKPYIIGYTSGVFDLFHIGHLNILKRAKQHCDYLIVGVSTDDLVETYKHHRPVVEYSQRLAIVEACRYVDKVVPQISMDKMESWKSLKFDVMFHGDEWRGTELYNRYEEEFAKVGVKIHYLSHTQGISTTELRNRIGKND